MNRQNAIALVGGATGLSGLDASYQLRPSFRIRLSEAIDRLIVGLALAAPLDGGEVLDLRYADAMVKVFDQWFADKGLR